MTRSGCAARTGAALLAAILTSCATDDGVRHLSTESDERPPLVLRVTAAKVGDPAIASPEGSAAGTAIKPVMETLGYSTMTFGLSLLMAPVAVAAGVEEGARVYQRMNECRNRWNTLFGDPLSWFRATFRDVAVADQLAADVPALVANARPPVPVEHARSPTTERAPARNVVTADIELGIAQLDSADCGAMIRSRATVELRHAGEEQSLGQRRLVVDRRIPGDRLERWAASPRAAREDLRLVVADIAEKIALTYPQLAAVAVVATREPVGTSSVCSTDEMMPAGTVRCWYESIEQCRRVATRGNDGRTPADCIPRSALLPRWCFARTAEAAGVLTLVPDCGGRALPAALASSEATPGTKNATGAASAGSPVGAHMGDAMRKMVGLPPDPDQFIGLVNLEGETPELALGAMSVNNVRGLLVVTDRSVRYYDVDTKRPVHVMRFNEIADARIDASAVPFMSSCQCGVVIDWRTGERRTRVELLFIKGPLVGDPDAAGKALQAIRAHANTTASATPGSSAR
ncbi:MAG TPA: hypothetical protein VF147_04055 [Vicinamibacterales bacterium]